MECPVCKQEMELKRKDMSFNSDPKREYERAVFVCKIDDVWVTIEIPTEANPE